MSSTIEFNEKQLADARAKAWRQDGAALLTLEAVREWVETTGLVLFTPRPQQLAAPAASLVEATLGAANANPTAEAIATGRRLLARLVDEGSALPLNLLGTATDMPDFVVSAQVFSYVFTLRGDKAWKQPPSTTGASKVSPLGLRVYETLTERGALTAMELASELGREVTEAAILRTLVELWSQLRVIPRLQPGDTPAIWELTNKRYTRAIKAGANAGQPTALSALVSLYLAQAVAATEEEIETYLSPLTARSRMREVLHALTGARQLETVVLEGKTLLHIPGGLPEFAPVAAETVAVDGVEIAAGASVAFTKPKKVGTGRIAKFAAEAKTSGEFRGKPAKALPAKRPGAAGAKPAARPGARADGKSDRERRPFKKDDAKPTFTKPWDEEKKAKPAAAGAPEAFKKFRKPEPEDRAPLGPREQAGLPEEKRSAPKTSFDRAKKPGGFVKRAYTPRGAEGSERSFAKRPYTPRTGEGGERSFAKPRFDRASKPGGFGAKRPYKPRDAEGGGPERKPFEKKPFAKRPFVPRGEGETRSFAKPKFDRASKPGGFGAKRPFAPRSASGAGGFAKRPYKPRDAEGATGFAKRPYTPRDAGGATGFAKRPYKPRDAEGGARPFAKKPFAPRAEGETRSFAKPKFDRASKPGGFGAKRSSAPLPSHDGERSLPKRPYKPRAADADQRKFTNAPWVPEPGDGAGKKRSFKSSGGPRKSFGSKAGGGFGAKKFGAKPGGFAKRGGATAAPRPAKPEAEE